MIGCNVREGIRGKRSLALSVNQDILDLVSRTRGDREGNGTAGHDPDNPVGFDNPSITRGWC